MCETRGPVLRLKLRLYRTLYYCTLYIHMSVTPTTTTLIISDRRHTTKHQARRVLVHIACVVLSDIDHTATSVST